RHDAGRNQRVADLRRTELQLPTRRNEADVAAVARANIARLRGDVAAQLDAAIALSEERIDRGVRVFETAFAGGGPRLRAAGVPQREEEDIERENRLLLFRQILRIDAVQLGVTLLELVLELVRLVRAEVLEVEQAVGEAGGGTDACGANYIRALERQV